MRPFLRRSAKGMEDGGTMAAGTAGANAVERHAAPALAGRRDADDGQGRAGAPQPGRAEEEHVAPAGPGRRQGGRVHRMTPWDLRSKGETRPAARAGTAGR